jgi:hypothetical protein
MENGRYQVALSSLCGSADGEVDRAQEGVCNLQVRTSAPLSTNRAAKRFGGWAMRTRGHQGQDAFFTNPQLMIIWVASSQGSNSSRGLGSP